MRRQETQEGTDMKTNQIAAGGRTPRWSTRQEAMVYARIGSTLMNQWIQRREVGAKRIGRKILIDLNSLDDHINNMPAAGKEFEAA
jgi:hypothetical protein